MLSLNIYIERVSGDIGKHKGKVSTVIKFNSLQSEFITGLIFCVIINTRGSNPLFIKTIHYHKYLDQFLMVLLATFITRLIFVRQLMCSSGQNIGLQPFVSIVLQ